MYIGQLAQRTGASPKAIRHYEALGLLGPVARAGVYRVYTPQHVRQIRLIRQALALGLRLAALRPFLAGGAGPAPDWLGLAGQIERQRAAIATEQRRLRTLDAQLATVRGEILACLDSGDVRQDCDPPAPADTPGA